MKCNLTLSALLLLCATFAHAQMYKWVSPDGKVNYTDTPPPASAKNVEQKSLTTGSLSTVDLPYELATAVKDSPVTLYTTAKCPACDEARKFLNSRGVPFAEKTVTSNEDIAQFRQVGGDAQLPLLLIGRNKQQGYAPDALGAALTAVGYPETNTLPSTYRNPPAVAAAPKAATTQAEKNNQEPSNLPPIQSLPPAGNAPPDFRF